MFIAVVKDIWLINYIDKEQRSISSPPGGYGKIE